MNTTFNSTHLLVYPQLDLVLWKNQQRFRYRSSFTIDQYSRLRYSKVHTRNSTLYRLLLYTCTLGISNQCCIIQTYSSDQRLPTVYALQKIVYNLDMEYDIYWCQQRYYLITYRTQIRVVYDVSCWTLPFTPCIVHLDIIYRRCI